MYYDLGQAMLHRNKYRFLIVIPVLTMRCSSGARHYEPHGQRPGGALESMDKEMF